MNRDALQPGNGPLVVPVAPDQSEAMSLEPAVTIGDIFANQQQIRTIVGSAVVVVGVLAPQLALKMDTAWQVAASILIGTVAAVIMALRNKKGAKDQAVETKANVYSTATVTGLVQDAVVAGAQGADVVTVPPPPAEGAIIESWVDTKPVPRAFTPA